MTKKLLFLLALAAGLVACNDDDNVDYTKYYGWRDKNLATSEALAIDCQELGSDAYFNHSIVAESEPYSYPVLYRVLKPANEDSLRAIGRWITPYYTSTLKTHYTLYNPKSVMERFEDNGVLTDRSKRNDTELMNRIFGIGYGIDNKLKADTLESSQVKFFQDFTPEGVVAGWGATLQQMHIGDVWLIHIPWILGYGQAGSGSTIDPYSNLYFRIELCDITSWGGNIEQK